MKKILLCCLLSTFSLCAFNQNKTLEIQGAWKMVHFETVNGDKAVIEFPGKSGWDVTKIWYGNHFMGVGVIKEDTTVTDYYIAGTYTLDGNKYEEDVKILFYKPWEGKKMKVLLDIKNDTLIYTYPVDDKGQMHKEWAWIEKYVRIK